MPSVSCYFELQDPQNMIFDSASNEWTLVPFISTQSTTWSANSVTRTRLSLSVITHTQEPLTSYITKTTIPATNATATPAPKQSTIPIPTSSPSSRRPSTGAEAGIGVGVAAGVTSVAMAAFLIYRRRTQKYAQNRDSTMGLMDMKSPNDFDGNGEQQQALPKIQQPAVGELNVDLPIIELGELDATPTIMEMGESNLWDREGARTGDAGESVNGKGGIGESNTPDREERRKEGPEQSLDEQRGTGEPDKTEDEERGIGESIRTGDEKRI